MAGICSKAAGGIINKKGYNGNELQNKEFSDGSGLEMYDFNARTYDQQLGRFIQIDPMTDEGGQESWSPYHFGYNNPVYFSDPDGRIPIIPVIIILTGLLLSSEPANPPSSKPNPTKADIQRWEQAKRNQTTDVVTSVLPFKGPPGASSIVKAYVKKEIKEEVKEQVQKAADKVRNPDGSKGKPDHQEKVKELTEKAKAEAKPGEQVLSERKMQGHDSNRRPDAQIVDETGRTRKTFEAERKPNSQRNQKREAEYKRLGVETETHKVGN